MDCILRVIKGPDTGATCRLQPGPNLIGRSAKAALKLTPTDISWEHLVITRNGEDYLVENLSALGTYLDDAKITGPVKLRPRDQLQLSKETVLRMESLDGDSGLLTSRRGLLTLFILVMLGLIGLVLWEVLGPETRTDNWPGAYNQLMEWVGQEAAAKRAPAETPRLLRDAWRLEQLSAYDQSGPMWLRLQLLLDSNEDRLGCQAKSAENPRALQRILTPPTNSAAAVYEPSDEEKAAAFSQFIKRRLAYSTRMTKKEGLAP